MGFGIGTVSNLIAVIALSVFITGTALAADDNNLSDEYLEKVNAAKTVKPLTNDMFGDTINGYAGIVRFSETDINLPGNNGLSVSLGRFLDLNAFFNRPTKTRRSGPFGEWEINVPQLHGTFATSTGWQAGPVQGVRCNQSSLQQAAPPSVPATVGGGTFNSDDYWSGNFLYVPGKGDEEVLFLTSSNQNRPADGEVYRWATKSQWFFSCLAATSNGVPGDSFLARAPDGTRYWFNQITTRIAARMVQKGAPGLPSLARTEVTIYPTRIEDQFGNWVAYVYDGTNPRRLLSITSNDGRQISLSYTSGGKVKSATDGFRTWLYQYSADTFSGNLVSVTLPDTRKRTYEYSFPDDDATLQISGCGTVSFMYPYDIVAIFTNPSGAKGKFTFNLRQHGRTYVPKVCTYFDKVPVLFTSVSLSKKEISGPGLVPMEWIWTYPTPVARYDYECAPSCPQTKTISVQQPNGSVIRQEYGIRYGSNEGLLLHDEQTSSVDASILNSRDSIYVLDPAGQQYPSSVATPFQVYADPSSGVIKPLSKRTVTRQGTNFVWQASSFDKFAYPLSVTRSSTLGYSRTDITAYHHNAAKWVIGQVAASTNSNTGLVESKTDYDANAMPWKTYAFGKLKQILTYNADGTLLTVKDGNNNTTTFANWKRGLPGKITFADAKFKSAAIDDLGQIQSVTDENGYTTYYDYDEMGRLTLIDYPDGDTPNWASTTISFAKNGSAIYGLPADHWRQTIATGNARKDTYFDALWRPVVVSEYDTANIAGTLRQLVTRYDAEGRPTFTSYPQRTQDAAVYNTWANPAVVPNASGTDTTYDALGRVLTTKADSELPTPLTATYEYLSGFQTRVTNPRASRLRPAIWPTTSPPRTGQWPLFTPKGRIRTSPATRLARSPRCCATTPTTVTGTNATFPTIRPRRCARPPR